MLYSVHEIDFARYRELSESSLQGEDPVFEELYNLKSDPAELHNLIDNIDYQEILVRLRTAWKKEIVKFLMHKVDILETLRY